MANGTLNYSDELIRFIKTVSEEANKEQASGVLGKLLQIVGGEREVYEFIVSEGFNITYDEFLVYYKACQLGVSSINSELSDDDLDQVAGGFGISSIKNAVSKVASTTYQAAYDTTKYVADNPGAFVAGAGVVGGGVGIASGTVIGGVAGAVIGSSIPGVGTVSVAALGATAGGSIGTGVGSATGAIVGTGTVIAANLLTN